MAHSGQARFPALSQNRGAVFLRRNLGLIAAGLAWVLAACAPSASVAPSASAGAPPAPAGLEEAVFAGGCFWCAEHDFEKIPGVRDVVSGYAGGASQNPTYRNHEGHIEVVRVHFDPKVIDYATLVERYWRLVDVEDGGGQFCDRGDSYRPAIFATDAQRPIAEASKAALAASGTVRGPIAVAIRPAAPFWIAEDYHQDYAKKNPVQYNFYRFRCGRDQRLSALWDAR
jgi:peptide-methionine (S)-S-oxide reductase